MADKPIKQQLKEAKEKASKSGLLQHKEMIQGALQTVQVNKPKRNK